MAPEHPGCVLQFAKAPVAGRAKTRLAPILGEAGAASVAMELTATVTAALRVLSPRWPTVLCVDDPGHPFLQALSREAGCGIQSQGEGDLGARMERACMQALRAFPAVILVGSDCTGYDEGYLRRAAALLEAGVPAVLGPAIDGGYVLLGLGSCPDGLFEGVRWGSADVAHHQRQRLAACLSGWRELPPRADIDRPGDMWMLQTLR